ncbi:hypothetical protein ABUT75_002323 [Flavobacterium psychrophilum]
MALKEICVMFEFVDIYGNGVVDCTDIIDKCEMLCEIFEFECSSIKIADLAGFSHLKFSVSFIANILDYDHKMNVIKAFAQEYQLTITNASSTDSVSFP